MTSSMRGSRIAQATATARAHEPTTVRRAFCRACRVSFEPRLSLCRLCGRPLKQLDARRSSPTADAPTPKLSPWSKTLATDVKISVDELGRTFKIEPTTSPSILSGRATPVSPSWRLTLDDEQIASGPTAVGLKRWLEAQLADGTDLEPFTRREQSVGLSGETR